MLDSFVALDLETTGLEPQQDRVVEIGAVRVEHGAITERYHQLINPGRQLPLRVRRLTGLDDGLLQDKPTLGEILPGLVSFVNGLPLVGHNLSFDLAFLPELSHRGGMVLDTLNLSRILLPRSRHQLTTLAAELGLNEVDAHRALADAERTAALYLKLQDIAASLPPPVLVGLVQLLEAAPGPERDFFGRLAAAVLGRFPSTALAPWPPQPEGRADAEPPGPAGPWTDDDLIALLAPGGPLSGRLPGYCHRPPQVEMLRLVAAAFGEGHHLLVEAGTGTGKSLAYLLPALAWAVNTRERVVISTQTVNLQEQLWHKDLPLARSLLGGAGRVALMKGRSHYICLRRWREAMDDGPQSAAEALFLSRVLVWLGETETGDRAELNLPLPDEEAWSRLASDSEACLGARCRYQGRGCFFQRARQKSQAADLVVANHALLLEDVKADNKVLPEYACVVLDEGHHLEEAATRHLGTEVDLFTLKTYLWRLGRGGERGGSYLSTLARKFAHPAKGAPVVAAAEECLRLIQETVEAVDELAARLDALVAGHLAAEDDGSLTLRLRPETRGGRAWEAAEVAADNACLACRRLATALENLSASLEEATPTSEYPDGAAAEVARYTARFRSAADGIARVMVGDDDGEVYWLEADRRQGRGRYALRAAPVNVGSILNQTLFGVRRSVVLTSATLTVGGKFDHIQKNLGLDGDFRLRTATLPSPFAYERQALLVVPSDAPDPRQIPEDLHAPAISSFLEELCPVVNGGILVLFTSHRLLRDTYWRIKGPLEGSGVCVLAQGIDGSRNRLVQEFRSGGRSILLGTASFWEGVDIPGSALSCVVIVRLPFAPPGEPVFEARSEALARNGLSPFSNLALPDAVLRFKQGFGRLIRSSTDRGAVVVLDQRLTQSNYGSRFIRSLPGPAFIRGSRQEVLAAVAAWLSRGAKDTAPANGDN